MSSLSVDLVVPTIGRASLGALLGALAEDGGPLPGRIVVVDDRRVPATPLPIPRADAIASRLRIVASGGRGPAAARNSGWRACGADWIAFLDDDVLPERGWLAALADDLAKLDDDVAGSQGRILVPRPRDRRPTDWERNVLALETAPWITADMAYRRRVLVQLAGFDERFRRAFREDTDFALRAVSAGHRLVSGARRTRHPVRPERWDASLRAQRGNADDVLMRAVHGPRWRAVFGNTPSRLRRHAFVTSCGALALLAFAMGRPSAGAVAFGVWAAGTGEFFLRRVEPGPRTVPEIARMLATSLAIPPLAVWHHLRGRWRVARWRRAGRLRWAGRPAGPWTRLRLVLFDRDGTLIRDVPGARDPSRVEPLPGAHRAVERLRAAGVAVAVVTNQHAVGEGAVTTADVARIHDRVESLLGPFGGFFVCPHARGDACECRKPRPGLLREALGAAGVGPAECALVGDIASDVDAARALGMRAVLVPTPVTRPEEVRAAPELAPDLDTAARRLLRGAP